MTDKKYISDKDLKMIFGNIHPGWLGFMEKEAGKDYFRKILAFLEEEYRENTVFPEKKNILAAFSYFGPCDVKAVILGQDPYFGKGQATGLAFAVPEGTRRPPSLNNIFKEIESETGLMPGCSDLIYLARQGVLLLNTCLTVREGSPESHKGCGWEIFTDSVIRTVSALSEPCVFMLWGKDAAKKSELADRGRHLVLKSAHPSPLSAYRGFFGCGHFTKANEFLRSQGRETIDWGSV